MVSSSLVVAVLGALPVAFATFPPAAPVAVPPAEHAIAPPVASPAHPPLVEHMAPPPAAMPPPGEHAPPPPPADAMPPPPKPVQTVAVGMNGLTFTPDTIHAKTGEHIVFEFYPKNHAIVESDFHNPCNPSADKKGINSGFVPSAVGRANRTFTIMVKDEHKPIWLYCPQNMPRPHCAAGMVAVINPTPHSPNTLEAFKMLAAHTNATGSTALVEVQGGVLSGPEAPPSPPSPPSPPISPPAPISSPSTTITVAASSTSVSSLAAPIGASTSASISTPIELPTGLPTETGIAAPGVGPSGTAPIEFEGAGSSLLMNGALLLAALFGGLMM